MQGAHLVLVEALEHVGAHVAEDRGAVGDEELAAAHGRGHEANKRAVRRGLLRRRLVVQADVVAGEGLLVDLLVDSILGRGEGAQARRVDRVEAWREAHRVVKGAEADLVLHQVKALEPDRAVLLEQGAEAASVLGEVRCALRVLRRGRHDLERARGQPLSPVGRLLRRNVDAFAVPHRARAVGERAIEVGQVDGRRSERRHAHTDSPARRHRDAAARQRALKRGACAEDCGQGHDPHR
jgi:hypothetical protein